MPIMINMTKNRTSHNADTGICTVASGKTTNASPGPETESHLILDSMRWFSQRRSSTPHIWGCAPSELWPPNSNSVEIFAQCTYPQVSSSYVYSFESYHVDTQTNTQTNRRRWKHPPFFATLWRWVIKSLYPQSNTNLLSTEIAENQKIKSDTWAY